MIAVVMALIVLLAWGVACALRLRRHEEQSAHQRTVEEALTSFIETSLDLGTLGDALSAAAETAHRAFRTTRVVLFEPAGKEGHWDSWVPGGESLEPVPDAVRGLFSWFKHNPRLIILDEIAAQRYGAMRLPLSTLKERQGIDVLLPLVDRGITLGAVGLALGHRPSERERKLLEDFRVAVTACSANMRLHREAAQKLTLEKEVDLASAVQQAIVPAIAEGSSGKVSWVGHFRPAGQAGSDFWTAYDLGGGRVLVIIGDVVGSGLAGSMVTAVAKSTCDAVMESGSKVDAPSVLSALNRALYRPSRPIHMMCFAALVDGNRGIVQFANGGHQVPYHVSQGDSPLGVLGGGGPILGELPEVRFKESEKPFREGDLLVLYTDGIVEATNASGDTFGDRRLQRVVRSARDLAPAEVRDRILGTLAEFRGDVPPVDDEALVVLTVR
ncbi:MAG: serine/threonine-protein phosphatase [Deltaproteobacteria bacterium]|nr:serine/threonine-protein phosphatase [Deltaproteobacteria bacterium]